MAQVPVCYASSFGSPETTYRSWVPCFTGNETNPYVPCCEVGSYCLEGNVCARGNHDDAFWNQYPQVSPYYLATCTDPSYDDENACTSHCETANYKVIVYTEDRWQCCGNGNSAPDCQNPSNPEVFNEPGPFGLATITSLALNYPAAVTDYVIQLSQPLASLALTNHASFDAVFTTVPAASATWWADVDSFYRSELVSGLPTQSTNVYTGPAPWTATIHISTMTPTISKQPATPPPSNKGTTIGPAVGVPVAVLLIGAFVGFLLIRRRRRQKAASPAAQHPEMAMKPHTTQPQYSPDPQHQSPAPPYGFFGAGLQDGQQKQPDYSMQQWHKPYPSSPPPTQTMYSESAWYEGQQRYSAFSTAAPTQQSMHTSWHGDQPASASRAGDNHGIASETPDIDPSIAGVHELPDAAAFTAAETSRPGRPELGTDSRHEL